MADETGSSRGRRKRELARADRVLPGLWRLKLPLPWPGVPHVNAYAVAAGSGVVLFDCGMHLPGSVRQLEYALSQAGLRLEHVRALVCTHAHADHYGQAATVIDGAGCELWLHPDDAHMRTLVEDRDALVARRLEVGLHSGVPAEAIEKARESDSGESGIARLVEPHHHLTDGVEIETDLGVWRTYETPGHAPSHVVFHQPDRRLLISGDHILGRVSLYYDLGWTPDPAGEFLRSLDVVEGLPTGLVLAGHGKPVRDLRGLVSANRALVARRMDGLRAALAEGESTAFDLVPRMDPDDDPPPAGMMGWRLTECLAYLRHLEGKGEVERVEGSDPEVWRAA